MPELELDTFLFMSLSASEHSKLEVKSQITSRGVSKCSSVADVWQPTNTDRTHLFQNDYTPPQTNSNSTNTQ